MRSLKQYTARFARFGTYLSLIIFLVGGCAKFSEFEAVFPPKNNSLSNYQKIVIVNSKPGSQVYDLMENAFKTQLTSIYPGNVKPAKDLETIDNEINLFSYNPRVDTLAENKIAYLSFKISADPRISRKKVTRRVPLQSCNYLNEKNPCRFTGTASLASGEQNVRVLLKGSIALKDGNGKAIISEVPINQTLSDSGKIITTPTKLIYNGINQIAKDYAKKIIPHKRKIKSEILRGGDSVSVSLIINGAFGMAINRLDRIVSKDDDPDYEDVFNLGLSYEALNELRPALTAYRKADKLEPDNDVIVGALKRVRKIIKD